MGINLGRGLALIATLGSLVSPSSATPVAPLPATLPGVHLVQGQALTSAAFSARWPRLSRAPWIVMALLVGALGAQDHERVSPAETNSEISAEELAQPATEAELEQFHFRLLQMARAAKGMVSAANDARKRVPGEILYSNGRPLAPFRAAAQMRREAAALMELILFHTHDPAALRAWAKTHGVELPWNLVPSEVKKSERKKPGVPVAWWLPLVSFGLFGMARRRAAHLQTEPLDFEDLVGKPRIALAFFFPYTRSIADVRRNITRTWNDELKKLRRPRTPWLVPVHREVDSPLSAHWVRALFGWYFHLHVYDRNGVPLPGGFWIPIGTDGKMAKKVPCLLSLPGHYMLPMEIAGEHAAWLSRESQAWWRAFGSTALLYRPDSDNAHFELAQGQLIDGRLLNVFNLVRKENYQTRGDYKLTPEKQKAIHNRVHSVRMAA